jgi:hypothetical protein
MTAPLEAFKAGLAWYVIRPPIVVGLSDSFVRLHQSKEHSDCKIVCRPSGVIFDAHKALVAVHSGYFQTAFRRNASKVIHLFCE